MKIPKLPGQKYVYVFEIRTRRSFGWQMLGRCKGGFSGNADGRSADVERSIKDVKGMDVEVSVFAKVPVYWHRRIEKILLNAPPFTWLRTREFEPASGGTECFKVFNWLCGLVTYTAAAWWGYGSFGLIAGLFIMFQPRPVDMASVLWFLFAVQLIVLLALAAGIIWLLWCLFIAGFAA